jgi:thiol-disulfide isomerase/thioredoxin
MTPIAIRRLRRIAIITALPMGAAGIVLAAAGGGPRLRSAPILVTPSPVLVIDSGAPVKDARLLWFQGRPAQPMARGTVVTSAEGEILAFSFRLEPRRLPVRAGLRRLVSAAAGRDGALWAVDGDGTLLRYGPEGSPVLELATPFAHPAIAVDDSGGVWAARSTERFEFLLDTTDAPLLVRLDGGGKVLGRVGQAVTPEHVPLRELASAGHIAAGRGRIFFAPFIRDEILAFSPAGDTLWRTTRGLSHTTLEPRFEVDSGRAVIDYHPVNLGIALGLDGNLYVLSTRDDSTTNARLDVFDPGSGRLLRSAHLDTPLPTLAGDANGRIYALDPVRLLSGTAPAAREPAPDLTLPLLGGGTVALRQLHGRVVLVNLWASWCAPCREEMPALAGLARRMAGPDFEFLAMSEDHDPDDAARFLERLGLRLKVPLGRGNLKREFHYPGLPFTVLIDRDGKVARTWIGYAGPDQIGLMETLIRMELERETTANGSSHLQHSH